MQTCPLSALLCGLIGMLQLSLFCYSAPGLCNSLHLSLFSYSFFSWLIFFICFCSSSVCLIDDFIFHLPLFICCFKNNNIFFICLCSSSLGLTTHGMFLLVFFQSVCHIWWIQVKVVTDQPSQSWWSVCQWGQNQECVVRKVVRKVWGCFILNWNAIWSTKKCGPMSLSS